MEIERLADETARREAVPIIQQLWSDAEPDEILAWTDEEEYHLFGGFVSGELVGVAGVLDREMLHHARHAWLYDLVVDEQHRGNGYGTELVAFAEQWATDRGCEYVALGSPLAKEDVHQFYTDQQYRKWGYIIEKKL